MSEVQQKAARNLRWGIIGCGDVVERKAASGIVALPNQKIVSAMRRDEEKLRRFAERYDVPHTTTDPAEVAHHPDVDIVYIATPPDVHLEYAKLVAAAGKGILIEKPVGRCSAETAEIARLCRDSGVAGFPSYYRRYQPKFEKVRELIESGAIGHVVSVRYTFRERLSDDEGWRSNPARAGGGRVYDLAGHVIDLIDLFCGPLSFVSGSAENLSPLDVTEQFAQLHFAGVGTDGHPVHGSASWNFAALDKQDELVIEGFHGRIRCSALKQSGKVLLEVDQTLQNTWKGSYLNRQRKKLRNKFWPLKRTKWNFQKPEETHIGLFQSIGEVVSSNEQNLSHLDSAVRTAALMDGALLDYYGSREIGFWDHPEKWRSLSTDHRGYSQRAGASNYADVTEEQVQRFQETGFAGPFDADIKGLESLFVPIKERKDVHLKDPQFLRLCTHPSITQRVAALVGSDDLAVFKTRIHTKVGFTSKTEPKHAVVPWHQDVGARNGGYDADGNPVPTYTVWIALDDVGPDAGPLCVLPGTQNKLYGDFQLNFHANLIEKGDLSEEDLKQAIPLTLKRGQFCVFHSWLLHGSEPNETPNRRAGFNIRYVENPKRGTEEYSYVDLSPW
jgi:predicted dehydrogenase